ncbi:phage head-tail connector protein [Salipaludibacillus sp. CF4.18]|uniref:phage head-tail connector protein n=1 Tax=Salipaludibacillus sp. CF4.18 TaxID=3373081 RepID=UPI003EE5C38C
MLEDIKVMLRISTSNTVFDVEINDLIESAKHDLILSGITKSRAETDTDPLIKRAVSLFVKANFGWDNPDAARLQKSYEMLRQHLHFSQEYSLFTITFTIDDGAEVLENTSITFNNEKKVTNSSGVAIFKGVDETMNMKYTVTLDGYEDYEGIIDVQKDISIPVTMAVV